MTSAIIFDCEYLVSDGAQSRHWCGPYDPDPVVVQIGAVRLDLAGPHDLQGEFEAIIRPRDRHGRPSDIPGTFVDLTGISPERVNREGRPLAEVLADLVAFVGRARLWSWGKDEFNLMAISCYVEGIVPPLPSTRFENACKLLLRAGMPYDDIRKTRSGDLAGYFGLSETAPQRHDGLADARSVARALQHLLRIGRLSAGDFDDPL